MGRCAPQWLVISDTLQKTALYADAQLQALLQCRPIPGMS